VHHRQCPMCREMEGKTLKDKTVLARLDGFVPVRIDVESLPQAQASRMFTSGWPHFAVLDAKGATIGALSGMRGPAEFGEGLARWAPVADASTPTWAEAQAKARERKAQARARDDLLAAGAQAATEPVAARRRLEQTAADLRGTPQGSDVAKVLAAWPEGAKFPELLEDGR
jgi:hypothetical protein